jgi:hypothetical protein
LEALHVAGVLVELSEGRVGNPPLLFASPELARSAIHHLTTQQVTLGRRAYLLNDLKSRHIIVSDSLLEDVKGVLRHLPGTANAHVKASAVVEIEIAEDGTYPVAQLASGRTGDNTGDNTSADRAEVDFSDVGHIVVHNTFLEVNLPPSSIFSRSSGAVTVSTGQARGLINPRITRRRVGSPEASHVLGADSQSVGSQSLPLESPPNIIED